MNGRKWYPTRARPLCGFLVGMRIKSAEWCFSFCQDDAASTSYTLDIWVALIQNMGYLFKFYGPPFANMYEYKNFI